MTSLADILLESPNDRAKYGVERAKSLAFDALHELWRKRRGEGRTQSDLASTLGKDEGWLSRNLRGPGNWTIKTLGEMVEALDGELEIIVHPIEDREKDGRNGDAYSGYKKDSINNVSGSDNPEVKWL